MTSALNVQINLLDKEDAMIYFYSHTFGSKYYKLSLEANKGAEGSSTPPASGTSGIVFWEFENTAQDYWIHRCVELGEFSDRIIDLFIRASVSSIGAGLGDTAIDNVTVIAFQRGSSPDLALVTSAPESMIDAGQEVTITFKSRRYSGRWCDQEFPDELWLMVANHTVTGVMSTGACSHVSNGTWTCSKMLTSAGDYNIWLRSNGVNGNARYAVQVRGGTPHPSSPIQYGSEQYFTQNVHEVVIVPQDQYGNPVDEDFNHIDYRLSIKSGGLEVPLGSMSINTTQFQQDVGYGRTVPAVRIRYLLRRAGAFFLTMKRYVDGVQSVVFTETFTSYWNCPDGSVGKNGQDGCVACTAGHYYNVTEHMAEVLFACDPCPLGTYIDSTGADVCTACWNANHTTIEVGSLTSAQCVCKEGMYGPWNTSQCQDCAEGNYCPPGTKAPVCAIGFYAVDGVCTPCPFGGFCAGNDSMPVAAPGYYLVSSSPWVFAVESTVFAQCNATIDNDTVVSESNLVVRVVSRDRFGVARVTAGDAYVVRIRDAQWGTFEGNSVSGTPLCSLMFAASYLDNGVYVMSKTMNKSQNLIIEVFGCAECSTATLAAIDDTIVNDTDHGCMYHTSPPAGFAYVEYANFTAVVIPGIISTRSLAYGDGTRFAVMGRTRQFIIRARDRSYNNITHGGDALAFEFETRPLIASDLTPYPEMLGVDDNGDGTYSVSYVSVDMGNAMVFIYVSGANTMEGTPMVISVGALCPAGEAPVSFAGPCASCEHGFYDNRTDQAVPDENLCPTCELFACTACPVLKTTANRGSVNASECYCEDGTYGHSGADVTCQTCPHGAQCPMGVNEPVAMPGYYVREDFSTYRCVPEESCVGDNRCGLGYTGLLCADCLEGYYRLHGVCITCPNWSMAVIIGAAVGAIVACIAAMQLAQSGFNFGALVIFFNYAQVITYFSRLSDIWPPILISVFEQLKVFNLNLDLLALPCSFDFDFWQLWLAKISVPIVVFFLLAFADLAYLLFLVCVNYSIFRGKKFDDELGPVNGDVFHESQGNLFDFERKTITNKNAEDDAQSISLVSQKIWIPFKHMVESSMNSFVYLLTLQYAYVMITAMSVFKCVQQDSGVYTMEEQPDMNCYDDQWDSYMPFAVAVLILYGIGTPVVVFCILFFNVNKLSDRDFRRKFGALYHRYRREKYLWELVIMIRKLCIVISFLFFTQHVMYQMIAAIVTLAVSLELHTGNAPYSMLLLLRLEYLSLASSTSILFCGLLFFAQLPNDEAYATLTVIACVILFSSFFVFLVAFVHQTLHFTRLQLLVYQLQQRGITRRDLLDADFARQYLSKEELQAIQKANQKTMGLVASMMHKSTHEPRPAYELLEIPPPVGDVCVAYLDIADFEHLNIDNETLKATLQVYHDVVRVLLLLHKGYEANISHDVVLVAFADVVSCVEWALHLQNVLLEADWPSQLLILPSCAPMYDVRDTDQLLWRGPRIRIGVHIGFVPAPANAGPKSKPVYQGSVVDVASLLCQHAAGGVIVMTTSSFEAIPSGAQQALLNDLAVAGQMATIALDMSQAPSRKHLAFTAAEPRVVEALPLVPNTLEGRLTTYVSDVMRNEHGDAFFNNVLAGHPHRSEGGLDPLDVLEQKREVERIDALYIKTLHAYSAAEVLIGTVVLVLAHLIGMLCEYLIYSTVDDISAAYRIVFSDIHTYTTSDLELPRFPYYYLIMAMSCIILLIMRQFVHYADYKSTGAILPIISVCQSALWPLALYTSLFLDPHDETALATVVLFCLFSFHVFSMTLAAATGVLISTSLFYFVALAYATTEPLFYFYAFSLIVSVSYLGRLSLGSSLSQLREMIGINETAEKERAKVDAVVATMIPPKIKEKLAQLYKSQSTSKGSMSDNDYTVAEDFSNVTVLFVCVHELSGDANIQIGPDVVSLLYRLFKGFDRLVQSHRCFKVEQVGSVFMAAVGVPERVDDPSASANRAARLAIDMVKFVSFFRTGVDTLPRVSVKVGIHSGKVRAGMLGKLTLHYSLFGDTVNTASRMMKYSDPGKIQMSSQTAQLLDKLGFAMECRGAISVKGKGTISTWWLLGLPAAKPNAADVFTRYIVPGILYPQVDLKAKPSNSRLAMDNDDVSDMLIEDEGEDFGEDFVSKKKRAISKDRDLNRHVAATQLVSTHVLPSLAVAADDLVEPPTPTARMGSETLQSTITPRSSIKLSDTTSMLKSSGNGITHEEQIIKDPAAQDRRKLEMSGLWLTFDEYSFEREFAQQHSLCTLPYVVGVPGGASLLLLVVIFTWFYTMEVEAVSWYTVLLSMSALCVMSLTLFYVFWRWNRGGITFMGRRSQYPVISMIWVFAIACVLDVCWAVIMYFSLTTLIDKHGDPDTYMMNDVMMKTMPDRTVIELSSGWFGEYLVIPSVPLWDFGLSLRVISTVLPLLFHVKFKDMVIHLMATASVLFALSLSFLFALGYGILNNPLTEGSYVHEVQIFTVYEVFSFKSRAYSVALTAMLLLRWTIIVGCMACFSWLARWRERHSRTQFSQIKILRINEKKETQLLSLLLPAHTVQRVVEGRTGITEDLADVTVVQTDFAGFTEMSAKLPPAAVFHILSEIFGVFDVLTRKHGLFKVYLIGDAYVAIGGIPGTSSQHRLAGVNFAYECFGALERINISIHEHYHATMNMRVGVASGHAIAGVLGLSNPRYLLFGPAPELADMMEQTGIPGRIHILGDVADDAVRSMFILEPSKNGKVTKPWSVLWDNKNKTNSFEGEDEEGEVESYLIVSKLVGATNHSIEEYHPSGASSSAADQGSLSRLSVGIPRHVLDLFNLNVKGNNAT